MFIVSIIGRPNVGKSSLFNRIIGKRVAVVDGMPGVTRDRHYHDASWNGCSFVLVDTGGLEHATEEGMAREIDKQVMIACEESDVILFLVEAMVGPTNLDVLIAKGLRKHDKNKVVLVINKAESKQAVFELDAFYALGFGPVFPVSSLHGKGVGDLLDHVCGMLRQVKKPLVTMIDKEGCLRIAIVGRPNSGKSSLLNRLVKKERMIVSAAPGTTRDSIDTEIMYQGTPIVLVDTGGTAQEVAGGRRRRVLLQHTGAGKHQKERPVPAHDRRGRRHPGTGPSYCKAYPVEPQGFHPVLEQMGPCWKRPYDL